MTNNHWDIEGAERKMRADIAQGIRDGDAMIASGQGERPFVLAAREFDEARLQFTIAGMRADNAGLDRNAVLAAYGFAMGSLWAIALSNCVGARERAVVNGWLQQSLAMNIGDSAAGKAVESAFRPVTAGHA